jgi:hypothetical protein
MYKNLSIGLLIVAFGLVAIRSTGTPVSTPPSPVIVARGKLVNQTAPIPTTTLVTPSQDAVYRVSVFAVITTSGVDNQSSWSYHISWTDDSGQESGAYLFQQAAAYGQFVDVTGNTDGGIVRIFEAKAGTPVTYSMSENGTPEGSVYSLYYVVEKL